MADSGVSMRAVLDGYAKFLKDKGLALAKHLPYLVRWVRKFLLFAQGHGGYTFEQTLDLFLAEIDKRGDVEPWQIQQPADTDARFDAERRFDWWRKTTSIQMPGDSVEKLDHAPRPTFPTARDLIPHAPTDALSKCTRQEATALPAKSAWALPQSVSLSARGSQST
jgi:hypothetical protein